MRISEALARTAVAAIVAIGYGAPAAAHDLRLVLVDIRATGAGDYSVHLGWPAALDPLAEPEIVWPDGCAAGESKPAGARQRRYTLVCAEPLEGTAIAIRYPIFNPALSVLARFSTTADDTQTALLPPERQAWTIPALTERGGRARSYLVYGVEHIFAGIDHLLFILGLLLVARTMRRAAIAITGFTLAHSLTLSLATFDVLQLPVPPIEAAIALSIAFLAREIVRDDSGGIARRHPIVVSSGFGLLHGMGFAAALAAVGLPAGDTVGALFFFNLGVEVGQLAFVCTLFAALAGVRALRSSLPWRRLETGLAYCIGTLAVFWTIERVHAFA